MSDCHRRIERFLTVLVRVAERGSLEGEARGAFEAALRYFRDAAPKHTADEEESLIEATAPEPFEMERHGSDEIVVGWIQWKPIREQRRERLG